MKKNLNQILLERHKYAVDIILEGISVLEEHDTKDQAPRKEYYKDDIERIIKDLKSGKLTKGAHGEIIIYEVTKVFGFRNDTYKVEVENEEEPELTPGELAKVRNEFRDEFVKMIGNIDNKKINIHYHDFEGTKKQMFKRTHWETEEYLALREIPQYEIVGRHTF